MGSLRGAAGRADDQNNPCQDNSVEQCNTRRGLNSGTGGLVGGPEGFGGAHDTQANAHIQGAVERGAPFNGRLDASRGTIGAQRRSI